MAWGNSLGDLIADVAIAKDGNSQMAIAGCFAGPLFNVLAGVGLSCILVLSDRKEQDKSGDNSMPLGIPDSAVALTMGCLFFSLLGTMMVVPCSGWVIPRWWAATLSAVYVAYLSLSIADDLTCFLGEPAGVTRLEPCV